MINSNILLKMIKYWGVLKLSFNCIFLILRQINKISIINSISHSALHNQVAFFFFSFFRFRLRPSVKLLFCLPLFCVAIRIFSLQMHSNSAYRNSLNLPSFNTWNSFHTKYLWNWSYVMIKILFRLNEY